MKLEQLLNEGIHETVEDFITNYSEEISKMISDKQTPAQAEKRLKKQPHGVRIMVFKRKINPRVWTRGDGSRYKEPSYLYNDNASWILKEYPSAKKVFKSEQDLMDMLWEKIKSMPKAKRIGEVSGEFGSSKYHEAYKVGSVVFIRRNHVIEYVSPSILRNKDVWRIKGE